MPIRKICLFFALSGHRRNGDSPPEFVYFPNFRTLFRSDSVAVNSIKGSMNYSSNLLTLDCTSSSVIEIQSALPVPHSHKSSQTDFHVPHRPGFHILLTLHCIQERKLKEFYITQCGGCSDNIIWMEWVMDDVSIYFEFLFCLEHFVLTFVFYSEHDPWFKHILLLIDALMSKLAKRWWVSLGSTWVTMHGRIFFKSANIPFMSLVEFFLKLNFF